MDSKTKIKLIYSSNKTYAIDIFKRKKYFYELGLCYLLEGNLKETKKIWNKLDKNKNSMIYFSHSMLGFIENKIRDLPSYLQIKCYFESFFDILLQHNQNDFCDMFIKNISLLEDINCEVYKYIGLSLLNNGYDELAIDYLNYSLQISCDDIEAFYILGEYYLKYNKIDKACEFFHKILAINKLYYPAIKQLNLIIK